MGKRRKGGSKPRGARGGGSGAARLPQDPPPKHLLTRLQGAVGIVDGRLRAVRAAQGKVWQWEEHLQVARYDAPRRYHRHRIPPNVWSLDPSSLPPRHWAELQTRKQALRAARTALNTSLQDALLVGERNGQLIKHAFAMLTGILRDFEADCFQDGIKIWWWASHAPHVEVEEPEHLRRAAVRWNRKLKALLGKAKSIREAKWQKKLLESQGWALREVEHCPRDEGIDPRSLRGLLQQDAELARLKEENEEFRLRLGEEALWADRAVAATGPAESAQGEAVGGSPRRGDDAVTSVVDSETRRDRKKGSPYW